MKTNIDTGFNERLNQLIKWSGLTVHAFAKEIGMNSSTGLYNVIRKRNGLSLSLLTKIICTFPGISYEWLLTGEGEMEINKVEKKIEKECIDFTFFDDIDMAIKVSDNAMYPLIPAGCIAVAKKQNKNKIIYGRAYMIEIDDISLIRIIRENEISKNFLTLVATEGINYDKIDIKRSMVTNIYLIRGIINNFG